MKNPVFTGAGVAIITPMYEDGSVNFDELGRIIVTSKVRGRKKAVRYLADALRQKIDPNEKQLIGIAHADCKEDAETLEGLIRESCPNAQFLTVKYEPVTGAHVGPGALALFFLSKDTWR